MTEYEEINQRQINMCKGNIKSLKKYLKNLNIEYLNDVVLLTEACGRFQGVEFEIIDLKYIKGYPTLITNKIQNGLTGKGFTAKKLKTILNLLLDTDILCVNLGFLNYEDNDIDGVMTWMAHNIYDLKIEETKKLYGNYAFELFV